MKEEILKLLDTINLKNDESYENYEAINRILKDFEEVKKRVKECNEDSFVYDKIKDLVSKMNDEEIELKKFRILKYLNSEVHALLF